MKKILYVCDRKKCKNCDINCNHTTDISHAKNFKRVGLNTFIEQIDIYSALSTLSIVMSKVCKKSEKADGKENE